MLKEDMERQGNLFFRYRSYLPILLLFLFYIGIMDFHEHLDGHFDIKYWDFFCLTIAFIGLGIRVHAVGHAASKTSGRNSRQQVAATINTSGLYSIVRHPLYLGNFLIWLSVSLMVRTWWVSLLTILLYIIFYERIIITEEEFLRKKFGETYQEWADQTPLFLPKFNNWRRPELPFSLKKALKGEYSTFFAIVFLATSIKVIDFYLLTGKFLLPPIWKITFLASCAFYLIIRFLALKTSVLKVAGR